MIHLCSFALLVVAALVSPGVPHRPDDTHRAAESAPNVSAVALEIAWSQGSERQTVNIVVKMGAVGIIGIEGFSKFGFRPTLANSEHKGVKLEILSFSDENPSVVDTVYPSAGKTSVQSTTKPQFSIRILEEPQGK